MATGCFDDFRKQFKGKLKWYNIIFIAAYIGCGDFS